MPAAYSDYMVYDRSTNRPSLPTTSNRRVAQTSYARDSHAARMDSNLRNILAIEVITIIDKILCYSYFLL